MMNSSLHLAAQIVIGAVWVFHGGYSKLFNGIPRHRQIVARVLGDSIAGPAIMAVGSAETLLGIWAWTGHGRLGCAALQTLAIVAMNTLEIALARDLLISAGGMVLLNAAFVAVIWTWALG